VQVSSTVHNKPSFVPKRNPQNNPRLRKRSRRIRFVLRSIFPHPQSHTPQGSGAFFGGGCRSTFGAAESFFSLDSIVVRVVRVDTMPGQQPCHQEDTIGCE